MCCLLWCWRQALPETAAGLSLACPGPALALGMGCPRSPGQVGASSGAWGEGGEETALLSVVFEGEIKPAEGRE